MAIVVAAVGFGFLWSNKTPAPVEKPAPIELTEEKLESAFPVIPSEQLYATSETLFSWVFDPTNTEKMLAQAEIVVRAKVLSAEKAGLLHPGAPSSPYTPLNVQVLEVLSGDMELGAQTLYFPGGAVTAEEYLSKNPTSGQKMGLADLSAKEQKSKYLQFTSETDFDIKKNTEYVF
ncbi:MAG: hypothetical protein LBT21_04665, partial [Oscillospiraceae bacterium]|nr:hypothetical protein [Oscillospiraceae bacterium]